MSPMDTDLAFALRLADAADALTLSRFRALDLAVAYAKQRTQFGKLRNPGVADLRQVRRRVAVQLGDLGELGQRGHQLRDVRIQLLQVRVQLGQRAADLGAATLEGGGQRVQGRVQIGRGDRIGGVARCEVDGGRLLVGSHGNLISLVLQSLEPAVDFAFHMAMPMPALYRLSHDGVGWRVMGGHGFRSIAEES